MFKEKMITLKELGCDVIVNLKVPDFCMFESINQFEQAHQLVTKLTPKLQSLAKKAYLEKDTAAWEALQQILYYWNYRDIKRISRLECYDWLVELSLRKIILDEESHHLERPKLDSSNNFNPNKAVHELAEKARNHRINSHPLLTEMVEKGINKKAVQVFLSNYYVNNRLFHLFIVALSLCSPLERRSELANNFYDEMGSGEADMAHPLLFVKNFHTIGLPSSITPLPEALHLANTKTALSFLEDDYFYGMGGFGFIELTMPDQMKKILAGLENSGLPRSDLEFWKMHILIDQEHGKTWFSEMLKIIDTPEKSEKCLFGGMRLLEARAVMYDGIYRKVVALSDTVKQTRKEAA